MKMVAKFLFVFMLVSCRQDLSVLQEEKILPNNSSSSREAPTCSNPNYMSHFITLEYAFSMIDNYQRAVKSSSGLCDIVSEGGRWIFAETFAKEAIMMVLNQNGCCKFRVYYGLDRDNALHLIMVGVNSKNGDIIKCRSGSGGQMPGDPVCSEDVPPLIVEAGLPCPQACDGVYITP